MCDELTLELAKDRVLIIDEFDLAVEKFSTVFTAKKGKHELKGMGPAYHAKRKYIFSATVEVYH